MQIAMVGLGRMGANLVRRLMRDGHECVVYDVAPEPGEQLAKEGATAVTSLADLAGALKAPRVVWVMVPAAFAGDTVRDVAEHLEPGDVVIDGGNSNYRDDVDRAAELEPKGIHYLDIGTSGGVFGLDRGYCLMVGGTKEAVEIMRPALDTIAPGVGTAERTPGRTGDVADSEKGWLHCGPAGAGHFVKMVHNGIEYGVMAAYAEGLAILDAADLGTKDQVHDAETTPLRDPQYYQYDIDTAEVAEVWRRGSVIGSWLLDLTAGALLKDPGAASFKGRVSDSGEGRWTVAAAVDLGVPAHVITTSLFERFSSRGNADFADRVLSAMRKEFGGHAEGEVPKDQASADH